MSEYSQDHDPGTVSEDTDAVAVVGMSLRVPGSTDLGGFWKSITDGVVSLRADAPEGGLRAGQIDRFDRFDADLFGMLPAQAAATDPQHRVLTEVAWQALEDAGIDPERATGRIGVFVGCGSETYYRDHVLKDEKTVRVLGAEQIALGNSRDFLATGLAYRLGLTGPAITVQTACSTSLVAVHQAIRSLLTYECDIAIAGGATVHLDEEQGYVFAEGGITSPDGRCRAFTEGTAGTVPSSGAGIVVLRRASDLPGTGENARAHLLGSAVNNDGAARMSPTAPSPQGQADVLREALAVAGLEPVDVGYVETHGTGTTLGDQVELAALAEVYGRRPADSGLALGAVKPNIGHCDSAAGVIGLIKAVLAVETGVVPPTPSQPGDGPDVELGSASFELPRVSRPWPDDRPRTAGVSSFGLGGTNCHVLLTAAPRPTGPAGHAPAARREPHLAVLSAATPEALQRKARDLAAWLDGDGAEVPLGELTGTLWHHRKALPERWATALPADPAEARDHLVAALTALTGNDSRRAQTAPRLAAVLPGQGVPLAGAGAGLAAVDDGFAADLAELAAEVSRAGGPDLSDARNWPADDPRLLDTAVVQPLLLVLGLAGLRHAERHGLVPELLLGHSVGELTAAAHAGVFSVPDAVAAVVRRGRLMASAEPGTMTAVRTGEETAVRLAAGLEVDVCVLNGPDNTVCGGPEEALAAFEGRCAEEGIRTTRLPVTRAGHSRAMAGAAKEFEEFVATLTLSVPAVPIVSGLTGALLTDAQAVDPAHWGSQLSSPVRFTDAVTALLEAAPDSVLGLHRSHAATAEVRRAALAARRDLHVVDAAGRAGADETADWYGALAALWTAGHTPAGPARPARVVAVPAYPFADQRHWVAAPEPGPLEARPAGVPAPDLIPAADEAGPVTAATGEPAEEASTAEAVRTLWQDTFGIAELRSEDNFFDLGGTSLHAAHLVSVVNDALLVEIRLQDLYENSSLAGFIARAEALAAERDDAALLRLLEEIESESEEGRTSHE
ncbi:type I polyketide synthase [Streptomyces triticiradicis]|uniref:Acyltransferase domain-containing protein n=1 Tax=Streptomyces triticiradicis TaxID=2651189 RepID=A0A7J5DA51_9ACTN|nr:type I polyketide synthase [Streptomyces triticiradicis]KAB1981751.1 acyltransferase domain-containing protein [Streptomyces triticiradicis]